MAAMAAAATDGAAQPLRLLVVDDHHVVRAGLTALLGQEPGFVVVADAGGGEEAVAAWQKHLPDVTLMDLSMPAVGGVEAIRRIRQLAPLAVIVVLSTYDGEEDIYNALRAGARGYLLKNADPADLFHAVRRAWSGRSVIPAEIGAKLASRLSVDALTDREVQIIGLVAKGQSNKQIGASLGISEGTVKTHLKNILDKLDANSRTEAAAIAVKRGIVRF